MNAIAKTVKVFQSKRCENCDYFFNKGSMTGLIKEGDFCSRDRNLVLCKFWEWDGIWCGIKTIFSFILKWAIIWTVIHEIMN